MEQVKNGATLDLLQAIATQNQLPKTGSKADGDFQKLMDKAAAGRDAKAEEAPKAARDETPAADKTEEAPVQKEDALTRIKKMLEQNGTFAFKPDWPNVWIDKSTGETIAVYDPGEYVLVYTGEEFEAVPIVDLEPWQQAQLDQLLIKPYPIDVSDPELDAILEATDPTVDHSPAALLEKVVAEQFGKVVDDVVERVRPEVEPRAEAGTVSVDVPEAGEQEGDDDPLMEVVDAGQAPQPLFHNVKAAPIKVGEVYDARETEETNVARQVDNGVAQALEKGESMVRIQLEPENLGSVTVEITRSAEGVIRVALNAHSGETRSLLERHAGELQGLLGSRTQQDVEVSVQRQQESQQNQNHNYDGHNGHAQDGEQRQRRQHKQTDSQDFIHQLRLGLVSVDGDNE